MTWHYGP